MSQALHLDPHVRMLWSNTVDVIIKKPGQDNGEKIGSFATYGKVMSFVMSFLFGVEFDQIELNGRIHFVRPKELERFKQSIPAEDKAAITVLFDEAIKQVKNVQANPASVKQIFFSPGSSHKIPVLSLNPSQSILDHDALEELILGNEFKPKRTSAACPVGVYFLPFSTRPQADEIEHRLEENNLGNTPTAVVITQLWKDFTKAARPQDNHSGLELLKNNHRVFHVLIHRDGLNECTWNEEEVANIRKFLKDQNKLPA